MDAVSARSCYLSICYTLALKFIRKHNRAIARSNKEFAKKYPYAGGLGLAGLTGLPPEAFNQAVLSALQAPPRTTRKDDSEGK
jgi:hypothetical protein